MNNRKYKKRRYKKRKLRGRGLLGRNRWSRPPLYLSKLKQKGGFMNLVAAPYLAVPFLAKLLSNH